MITQETVGGQRATVAWMHDDFSMATSQEDATLLKVIFENGTIAFLVPKAPAVTKYDASQPRAPAGSPGGGEWVGENSGAAALITALATRSEWPSHIQTLKIPPAWTDVRYSEDPAADLLAIGKDAKGRAQYVYSERFAAGQAAAKFERVNELLAKQAALERQNAGNMDSTSPTTKAHADALAVVMNTGVRPGSERDTGGEKQAYGITTLEGRHVVVTDGEVHLQFVGKAGKDLNIPVTNAKVRTMLQARAKTAGPSGRLFPGITQSSLGAYTKTLDGGGFKTKDFRTAVGTRTALETVSGMTVPTSHAAYKRAVTAVAKAVSKRLGNTPVVALQSYINPTVFAAWRAALGV